MLEIESKKCIFLEYNKLESKAKMLDDPKAKKLIVSFN